MLFAKDQQDQELVDFGGEQGQSLAIKKKPSAGIKNKFLRKFARDNENTAHKI
jgi:hypothetical protein